MVMVPAALMVTPGAPATSGVRASTWSSVFMLATEKLKKLAAIPLRHIPFNGVPPAINAILAGDVQVGVVNLAPSLAHIKAGKLRALAVLGPARDPLLPDVPTLAEAGVRGYDISVWLGLFAPAGTPPDVTQRLSDALTRAVQAPDVRERLAAAGAQPATGTAPELARLVRRELVEYDALAREVGVAANATPRPAYAK